jgi:fibronectin-binding autotransporter adhesin
MNRHASINRAFRLIWREALGCWVPAAEIARGRGKRNGRCAAVLASLLIAVGLSFASQAQASSPAGRVGAPFTAAARTSAVAAPGAVPPSVVALPNGVSPSAVRAPNAVVPSNTAPNQLPTGGKVVAGQATLVPGGNPSDSAVLNVDQTTQRAVINWNTFNLGSAAEVNFNQPGAASATLNRVLDSNPSEIFGKINAPGQVFLTNPNGMYFGKSASVDVGALTATTNSIGDADFMAAKITLTRNGATGSVVNDGQLTASLGGYIALLAPEVRNSGVIIARMGTVAMAAGESITLDLDGNHLAGITAQPSAITALVENRSAVLAPGGLIILSAKAVDSLQGGVVRNSGTLEATGLATKGGRIVLEASAKVENSGTIDTNAGADGSPAGSVAVTAPAIVNSGSITAAAGPATTNAIGSVAAAGGNIVLTASTIVQKSTGTLDVSGATGGSVKLQAAQDITIAGNVSAAAADNGVSGGEAARSVVTASGTHGGNITLAAGHDVTLQDALLDASGVAGGGQIVVQGGGTPGPTDPPGEPPTVALLGDTQLRTSSRRGRGGEVTLTGNRVGLLDTTSIDTSGVAGGGNVFVGGGFHGHDPSVSNARQVAIASTATIDASATQAGDGGNVAVWSDGQTSFTGSIAARGGAMSGAGGMVEVSGKGNLDFAGIVNASAKHGAAGTLLLDPQNITVDSSGAATLSSGTLAFATNAGTDSVIAPATITAVTNTGTAVTLQANNDLTINSSIVTVNGSDTGGALTFQAGRSIMVNASVISDNGNIRFTANDSGATSANRAAGTASFTNNSVIDAGSGTMSITMGTFAGTSGAISTGHVVAANLTITQNGPTSGAVSGSIDLGESDLTNNLTITASSDRNVTNTLGSTGNGGTVVVRGTATINVGAGDVTINGPHTDFTIIGLTARNVTLNDTNAVQFTTTNVSGTLTETTVGPIATIGPVQVGGAASFTANSGGFGYADPYIAFTDSSNHFGGGLTLSVPSSGNSGTGGYATIVDSGALTVTSSNTATSLQLQAGGAVTTGTVTAGTFETLSSSSGAINLGATTTGQYLSVTAAGAVSLGTTNLGNDLTISTSGAITNTGAISVPRQTIIAAGSANNVTLDNANNAFNYLRIVSGNDVTLVDKNGIIFGSYYGGGGFTSHIYGDLNLTAGGDINQVGESYYDGYSAIEVDGASTFTANAGTPINLYLGTNNPFNGYSGQSNNFAGSVTLARNGTGTGFSTVEIRNTSATASVLRGLTSVGTLANVYLSFDNAPSVSLPGMTVTGNLYVNAPNVANTATTPANIISQTGPIVAGGALSCPWRPPAMSR